MNYKQMLEEFDRLNKVSIDIQSEFKRLEVKFDELLRRIKRIEERLDEQQSPSTPLAWPPYNIPPIQPDPFPSQPTPWNTKNCSLCGLELKGVMGYVCPQPGCPTGLGGPMCNWRIDPYVD